MENLLAGLQYLPYTIRRFNKERKMTGERIQERYSTLSVPKGTPLEKIVAERSHDQMEKVLEVSLETSGEWVSSVLFSPGKEQKHLYIFRAEEDGGCTVITLPLSMPDEEIQQYDRLIENIPGIDMFLLDNDLQVLIAVGHEVRRNGWDSEKFPGGNIEEVLQGKLLDIISVLLPLASKGTPVFREFSHNKKFFSLRLIPVFDGGFSVNYTVIFLQDATTSKRTEIRLRKSIRSVEEANKGKSAFISHMSHEIRTPLNAILGFAEQLEKTRLNKTQLKYLDILKNSSQHLLSIVNDVLTLSKFEAGKFHFEEYPFSIPETAQTIREVVEMRYSRENVDFRLLIDPAVEESVVGDAGRLRQVLMNLINNAMKFTSEGHVELRCTLVSKTEESITVRFEVSDTGIGIPKHKRDLIFEPFKQLDSSLKRKYAGTGLGLTICKSLVESQGGTISVDSEVGKGSTFGVELTFRLDRSQREKERKSPRVRESISFTDKNILVVDDDPVNSLLAEIMLKNLGVKPVIAEGGEQAIKLYTPGKFDLILLDIQMPNVSGIDVVRHIRAMEKELSVHTIVLAMTANVLKEDLERYIQEGMDGHLIKPFTEERLAYSLNKFLGGAFTPGGKQKGSLLKLDDLLNTTKGDNEFTLLMLDTFEQNARSQMKKLKNAVKSAKIKKVGEIAHRLIPSFEHLGAEMVSAKFKKIEKLCEEKTDGHLEEVTKEVDIIAREVNLIMDEIAKIKKQYQT